MMAWLANGALSPVIQREGDTSNDLAIRIPIRGVQ